MKTLRTTPILLAVILLFGCTKENQVQYNPEYCDKAHTPKQSILQSANAGDPKAQMEIAEIFNLGHCGNEDDEKALEWLLKSANQNYAPAQTMMGLFYMTEQSVDVDKAILWLNKAIEQNDSVAMFFMADIYYYEGFGRQDKEKALYWVKKSAELGNQKAIEKLKDWQK